MGNAVDYAWARPDLNALWDAGVREVGRYIGPAGWGKTMEQAEYDALVAKFGRENVFGVFEIGNDDTSGGFNAGVDNARTALQWLPAGYPDAMPVFLAADENLSGGAFDAALEYFHGGSTIIGGGRLGDYGQGSLLIATRDAGYCGHHWLSGSTSFPGYAAGRDMADIVQGLDGPLAGTDDDIALRPLMGQPIPISPINEEEDMVVGVSPTEKTKDGDLHRASIVMGGLAHIWIDASGKAQDENVAARAGNEANPPNPAVAALTFSTNQVPTCELRDGDLVIAAQTVPGGTSFEFIQSDGFHWNCRELV